jgi:drug/metabolite transporter (DMT)-like permease
MLINNAMGMVLATAMAAPYWQWPQTAAIWGALVAMGLVMVTAQIALLSANQRADASFLAPFFYLTLVWAGLYDLAVFGVWPDAVGLGGAAIILSGGLLMTWREMRARAPGPPGPAGPRESLRPQRRRATENP